MVMAWEPTARADVAHVATPDESATAEQPVITVPSALKATAPTAGAPEMGVTVAVKVTVAPTVLAPCGEEVSAVVVEAAVTLWVNVDDVDVTKLVGLVDGVKTAFRL